jgi:hypothetical protein
MEKIKLIVSGALAQIKDLWKVLALLYAPIVLLFVLLSTISRASDNITLSYFTRDISAIGNLPFFAGLVSQLGGLLWAATLAVCIFAFFIIGKQDQNAGASRRFLLQAGILTLVLMLDDFFLFHEDIGPDYLNVSEKVIVLTYLVLCALFLILNYREILASEYLILGLALGMFAVSIFLDAADLDDYERYGSFFSEQFQIFLEDGFKSVGVVTWLAYFARYGYQKITGLGQDIA